MAMSETFYTLTKSTDTIPPQYEWYQDLDSAKSDAVDSAEDEKDEFLVYEITVRPLYRTVATITLESM